MSGALIVEKELSLTARDLEIMEMIGVFGGKTSSPVLEKTFWHGKSFPANQARRRMDTLRKKGLLKHKPTGLISPRNIYIPTAAGRELIYDRFGIELSGTPHFSLATFQHNATEQIAWYWLRRVGKDPKRAIVRRWSPDHKHTPDLYYEGPRGLVYVEIEISKKRPDSYISIFNKMREDGIHAVLYIFENEKRMKQIGRVLPAWGSRVHFTNLDRLIGAKSLSEAAVRQEDFILQLGENQ